MALIQLILHNFFSFVFIISIIVFIHEFGHFWVARLCGVKVDEFSLGFGPKIFSRTDKKGTLWKICALPFGGYVKMFGDRNASSMPDLAAIAAMSTAEKKLSFIAKNVWQRMAIVAAGPAANFILAIFILTILFKINGLTTVLPVIDEVLPQSAAFEVGLKKGDKILAINQEEISDFDQLRAIVSSAGEQELNLKIERLKNNLGKSDVEFLEIKITPKVQVRKDFFGEEVKLGMLGVSASELSHQNLNLAQSFVEGAKQTYQVSGAILKALGELITGKRDFKELGGPIKIAKYSGKTVEMGLSAVAWFVAMISINLGVMNLLPVPVLDGGHLFFYVIEAICKKPLPQKVQKVGFQIGFSLVLMLMIFTTFNDVLQLFR